MISDTLAAALEKRVGTGGEKTNFVRAAIAEKLARDFGEQLDASALAVRVGQGRRTDLERRRAELARERAAALPALRKQAAKARCALAKIRAAEKTLAPYGGAAKVISTGEEADVPATKTRRKRGGGAAGK